MTMASLKKIQDQLKKEKIFASKAELISFTLDPEFDTNEKIQRYAEIIGADPAGWKWLRCNPEETKATADQFQMIFKKDEGNVVAHNTTMYSVDKKNKIYGQHFKAGGLKKDYSRCSPVN
jgi:protein SCO1